MLCSIVCLFINTGLVFLCHNIHYTYTKLKLLIIHIIAEVSMILKTFSVFLITCLLMSKYCFTVVHTQLSCKSHSIHLAQFLQCLISYFHAVHHTCMITHNSRTKQPCMQLLKHLVRLDVKQHNSFGKYLG